MKIFFSVYPARLDRASRRAVNKKSTWSILLRGALAGILLVLGGCAIDQKSEIGIYRKEIDANKPAPAKIEPDQVLTLTDALRLANQNQEQISLQGENYLQALVAKDKAFSAFLPTIGFDPSWSVESAGGVKPAHTQALSAPLEGGMNFFNGFRDYYTLKSGDQTIEQQKQLIYDAQQTVLLDVAQTYYQVLTSEQSVEVLANSLQAQDVNLRYVNEQQAVGTALPLNVAEAASEESQTKVQLLQSQADVRNARAMLAYLVGEPIENNPLRDDFEPPASVGAVKDWEVRAEAGRQDLRAAAAAVRSARYQVEVAFGQYYPSATLNLNYYLYNQGFQPGTLWTGALQMNLPIFTGGLIHAEVRQAWSLFRQAALTQEQLKRQIDEGVEQAYINLDLAHQELAELQIEVKAARDEYNAAYQQFYVAGGTTYLAVLQAQITLISAQLQLTTEQFTQKTAYFNLLRTAGGLSYAAMQSITRPAEASLRNLATQPATLPSLRPQEP